MKEGIEIIKQIVKKVFPENLQGKLRKFYNKHIFLRDIRKIRKRQTKIVGLVQKKETVNIIFLVMYEAVWKYEELYTLLINNSRFKVTIVTIPRVRNGVAQMDTYEQTINYFDNKGYNTFHSYDQNKETWLDVKDILKPDLVFFTNPYSHMTFSKYTIDNFLNTLTAYVPYCIQVSKLFRLQRDGLFHSKLWKQFYETKIHQEESIKKSRTKGDNVVVTGFPGVDSVFNIHFKPKNIWKTTNNSNTTKIIWAPHHSIPGQGVSLDWSNFLDYHDYFLNLIKTNNHIQIAFKPHPLLKEKLYKHENWGMTKTNSYYDKWRSASNGQLEESYYVELFKLSDALITDSGGFIVEYLYFEKPILFAKGHDNIKKTFNCFGQSVFEVLYKAKNQEEVGDFINSIVLKKDDQLLNKRNNFLAQNVLPKNGQTASENIYNELIQELS